MAGPGTGGSRDDRRMSGRRCSPGSRDLLPVLRDRAQEAEDQREVPADSVKALAETGFFRLLQPARFGGLEADPLTFLTAVRMIASACGSTGWVASVLGVHPWQLALFPPQAQEEVWGADPATRMSVVLRAHRPGHRRRRRPPAQRPVELLLRLRPRQLGAARRDRARRRRHAGRLPHLPAARQRLRHRGRLGHRRAARHRQQRHRGGRRVRARPPVAQLHRRVPAAPAPARRSTPRRCTGCPYGVVFSYAITTPIIGMATGAYDAHVALPARPGARLVRRAEGGRGPVRPGAGRPGRRPTWTPPGWPLEHNMTELMALRQGRGEDPDRAAPAGPPRPGPRHRPGDQRGGPAVRELRRPGAAHRARPIQRFWRDAHAGRVHAINDPERALSMFGRGEFGLDVGPDAMV